MLRFSAILVLGVVVSTEIQVLARLLRPVMGLSSGAMGVVHESVHAWRLEAVAGTVARNDHSLIPKEAE